MDAIKIKLKSVAFLALVSVTVTGLPIAPPLTHYSQQPVQTEQFHAPQHHEHGQRNQDDRFEHPPMNLHDICAHHSQDTRHLDLCHPKLGPRSYPRPYQPDPHMSNAFPIKQDPQIRIRRGPEQQGNSFPKDSYFINRDQNVAQEQMTPMNRNHPGTRGPTGRHSINRTPFESIPSPFPPQDLNQLPCPGPGCPPHQNPEQRSPQHIHAPIVQNPPPTIPTNSHHPWHQSHGPAQRSDPTHPSQNPHNFPNHSPFIKPTNDDMRKPMATRDNPTNPQAPYASKLKDSKPCSLSSSSGSHYGKSCRILIVYDFSDADVTYETKLETFEG